MTNGSANPRLPFPWPGGVARTVGWWWRLLPAGWRRQGIRRLLLWEAAVPRQGGLPNLLAATEFLEEALGRAASEREGGIHPKHRLTGYHDFFLDRIRPGEVVLDVGCGNGAVAYSLASRLEVEVHGIDCSAPTLEEARQRWAHPKLHLTHGDARDTLPVSRCDVIVLSNILEHLPERQAFLRRLCDLLSPRILLIRVPLFERHWSVPLKKELGLPYFCDPGHVVEHTQEGWREELAAVPLRVGPGEVRWGEWWGEAVPE